MSYQFQGKDIETTATGYLVNHEDWSRELAEHIAGLDGITLSDRHWDVIDFLREEYFENNQSTPNTRTILKAMSDKWGGGSIRRRSTTCSRSILPSRAAGSPASRRAGARAAIDRRNRRWKK